MAADLKARKEALGLKPGIESEVILDSATAWDAQKAESAEKVRKGATVGGVGAAGGAIGNLVINGGK